MQGWKVELCAAQPKKFEQVNRSQYIQRENIEPYEKEWMDGTTEHGWKCNSRILTMDEYRVLSKQEEIIENQLTLMSAVAEVYESQNGGV